MTSSTNLIPTLHTSNVASEKTSISSEVSSGTSTNGSVDAPSTSTRVGVGAVGGSNNEALATHSFLYPPQAKNFKFGKLIIVSNRLPVTLISSTSEMEEAQQKGGVDNGSYKPKFSKSSGGLVTALTGMGRKFTWVGWLGNEILNKKTQEMMVKELGENYGCHPVFINKEDANKYYNGFSNSILWPLFHYLFGEKSTVFNDEQWEAYRRVNEKFADAVLETYEDGDLVWVHDYHLMLLPQILRKKKPNIFVAFFLHIPFPSSEIYRLLPVRCQLLEGVLASNLIGFHTHNFARHFLSSCTRILGAETSPNGLNYDGIFVNVQVFPIGIDPTVFINSVKSEKTKQRIEYFRQKYKDKKIIVGIDRLDYTKGLELKLHAFEKFLTMYPQHKDNTILIQVGVPTREQVKEYKELISSVNELVGKINSVFGTLDGFPLHYINKSVDSVDLSALYAIANACIVTSIRDGMNLVSCEYVVCQEASGGDGVLILSEFAGAAASLGGSLIINPWDIESTATALHTALDMPAVEKKARHSQNYEIVSRNTAAKWGSDFISMFENSSVNEYSLAASLPQLSGSLLKKTYDKGSGKRLFLLDYDGTLVSINKYPSLAIPTQNVVEMLQILTQDSDNIVYIISGRDQQNLENILGHIKGLGLAAEQGMYLRHPHSKEWTSLYHIEDFNFEWMKLMSPVLEHVESRTPGSFFEKKLSSLVFHYRNAEAEYGEWQARELALHLELGFNSLPVDIVHGKKVLEIRPQGVSKGFSAKKLVEKYQDQLRLLFCSGDDRTDEDMFGEIKDYFLNPTKISGTSQKSSVQSPDSPGKEQSIKVLGGQTSIVTCVIGRKKGSKALCYLSTPNELVDVLSSL